MGLEPKQNEPEISPADIIPKLESFRANFEAVRQEIDKVFVGQRSVVEALLVGVFSGGHILLTGVPGLGRTFLVKALSTVLGLTQSRIQFTPDLLPSDVLGSEILDNAGSKGGRSFRFFKGPIFSQLVLADEVNRSPARTQSALLEAMQERQVTNGGTTYWLPKPFLVIATRNNLETEGVWQMPEAQLDRFMVAIELTYLEEDQEVELLRRSTGTRQPQVKTILGAEQILEMQALATSVPVPPSVLDFATKLVRLTRSEDGSDNELTRSIRLGASPRATQGIIRGAKVLALYRGRPYVSRADVLTMAYPILEHRLVLDFRAASRGVKVKDVVLKLLEKARTLRPYEEAFNSTAKNVLRRGDAARV